MNDKIKKLKDENSKLKNKIVKLTNALEKEKIKRDRQNFKFEKKIGSLQSDILKFKEPKTIDVVDMSKYRGNR